MGKDPTKGKSNQSDYESWKAPGRLPTFQEWWTGRADTEDEQTEDWGKKDYKQWKQAQQWGDQVEYSAERQGKPLEPNEDEKPTHTHFRALEELVNSRGGTFFTRSNSKSNAGSGAGSGTGAGSGGMQAPVALQGGTTNANTTVQGGNVAMESSTPAQVNQRTNNQFTADTNLPVVPMNLLDWVRFLHRHRGELQEKIQQSITSEEFVDMEYGGLEDPLLNERLRLHVIESDFVKRMCEKTWKDWSKSPDFADAKILNPKKVGMALKAAKITSRKSAARMTNARLLSVDPAVLDTTRPVEKTSAVALKYFEPLFEHLQTHMPSMSTRELLELVNWGKWRVLWKPGTVFVRQQESPHVVGIVMEGLLASYTEDEVTASRCFVNMIRKKELVGSEDFQLSMFHTARRTIEVPTLEGLQELLEDELIPKTDIEAQFKNYKDEFENWDDPPEQLSRADLGDPGLTNYKAYIENLGLEIDEDLVEGLQAAYEARAAWRLDPEYDAKKEKQHDEKQISSRPTVMFVWEAEDLRRLMEVDP